MSSKATPRVILGVSGGIAAYKSALLLRLLKESGCSVRVIPTEAAEHFVGRSTWEALSGEPVSTSVFDEVPEVAHVSLGQQADLVIVAPATADLIARAAAGLANDLLTTTLLAARCPVVFAPAMHTEMWQHPATVANVATLRARGVNVLEPAVGRLTGADSGPGRMPEPDQIFAAAQSIIAGESSVIAGSTRNLCTDQDETSVEHSTHARYLNNDDAANSQTVIAGSTRNLCTELVGLKVLVTAGGTREPIDPARWIGNRSTGRQGVALALAALDRGAQVTLVAANVDTKELEPFRDQLEANGGSAMVEVETCLEMLQAVREYREQSNIIVMAAAVSDYRPLVASGVKIKKVQGEPHRSIELIENPDILAELCEQRKPGQVIIGFAAETGNSANTVLELGQQKAIRKGTDLLAVNEVGAGIGFGQATNHVWLVDQQGELVGEAQGTKREVADAILTAALNLS